MGVIIVCSAVCVVFSIITIVLGIIHKKTYCDLSTEWGLSLAIAVAGGVIAFSLGVVVLCGGESCEDKVIDTRLQVYELRDKKKKIEEDYEQGKEIDSSLYEYEKIRIPLKRKINKAKHQYENWWTRGFYPDWYEDVVGLEPFDHSLWMYTVFHTREEAEAALKRIEENGDEID